MPRKKSPGGFAQRNKALGKKTPAPYVHEPLRLSFESFRPLGSYDISHMKDSGPSVVNEVRIRRYRITVEEIEESVEVLGARLQELWDVETNHHRYSLLKTAAARVGYVLQGEMGSKAVKRT